MNQDVRVERLHLRLFVKWTVGNVEAHLISMFSGHPPLRQKHFKEDIWMHQIDPGGQSCQYVVCGY